MAPRCPCSALLTRDGYACRGQRASAGGCIKLSGDQIGGHLEGLFADFGIRRPLSSLGALLGIAQILGGFRTHGAASVDVHSGTSHMWGPLPHPRPLYALVRTQCAE